MWGSPTTTVVTMTLVQARTLPQEIWHVFQTLLDHSPTILYVSLILTAVFFALAIPVKAHFTLSASLGSIMIVVRYTKEAYRADVGHSSTL
jgi:hypothetical protein